MLLAAQFFGRGPFQKLLQLCMVSPLDGIKDTAARFRSTGCDAGHQNQYQYDNTNNMAHAESLRFRFGLAMMPCRIGTVAE